MTKPQILRFALIAAVGMTLAACVTDPRLNTGISIGADGVSMQPSVQANVAGGLMQYTPRLK